MVTVNLTLKTYYAIYLLLLTAQTFLKFDNMTRIFLERSQREELNDSIKIVSEFLAEHLANLESAVEDAKKEISE